MPEDVKRPANWLGNVPWKPDPAPLHVVLDLASSEERLREADRPSVNVRFASFDPDLAEEVRKDWALTAAVWLLSSAELTIACDGREVRRDPGASPARTLRFVPFGRSGGARASYRVWGRSPRLPRFAEALLDARAAAWAYDPQRPRPR